MYSKFWPKGGLPGILHHYTETLVAFEFTTSTVKKPHSLLFVGGLGDGLATTSYVHDLVKALQPTPWSLFTLNLSSSYQAWGLGHLDRDTDEIAQCVKYIQEYKPNPSSKITLMGHSTGSQDVLHYLYRPNPHTSTPTFDPELKHILRPAVNGAIMQAPVSDREVIKLLLEMREGFKGKSQKELQNTFSQLVSMAQEASSQNTCDTLLPLWMTSQIYPSDHPITARRFLSLVSPETPKAPREDDLFSSDIGDEELRKTFGQIRERGLLKEKFMVLMSGADQSVPEWVNKEELLARWKAIVDPIDEKTAFWDEEYSGIVPGASHALSNDDQAEPRADLSRRVLGFLQGVEKA